MCYVINKVNMVQSHQTRKLHQMDRINNQSHKQVFSRISRNPERTYATDKTTNKTNKKENTGPPTGIRWNNNQHTPQKSSQYIREGN